VVISWSPWHQFGRLLRNALIKHPSSAIRPLPNIAPFKLAKRSGLKRLLFGNGRELPPLDAVIAAELRKRLTPEIEEVERIVGRDLSSWKA